MKPDFGLKNILRLYLILSLMGAAAFSPSSYSLLPLAFLAVSLYSWWRGSGHQQLVVAFSLIFILPVFMEPLVGSVLAAAFALPLLAYLDLLLRSGVIRNPQPDSRVSRRPTNLGTTLVATSGTAGLLGVFLGSLVLELTSLASLLYFAALGVLILWSLPAKPLQSSQILLRVVAGSQAKAQLELVNQTRLSGQLYLNSPYPWFKITPAALPLNTPKGNLTCSVVPSLAGPASPEIDAIVLDQWGLSQVKFQLQPVRLHVIPRARYAAWLAKRYLEKARPGMVVSQTPSAQLGGVHAARKGGEFYGARPYQPGDNLKVIDWKHSAKLDQLIVQEFVEPYTSSPLLLVNLAAGDEEEADRLAFSIITTALTLAKENIPAAIAAYNEIEVVQVTDVLAPIELVRRALSLTDSISLYQAPTKYLKPPDLTRLRVNEGRLKGMPSDSAQKLAQLLSLELAAIKTSADSNPATIAAARVLSRKRQLLQVLIISNLNHDAEALMLLASKVRLLGLKPLFLEVGKTVNPARLGIPAAFALEAAAARR